MTSYRVVYKKNGQVKQHAKPFSSKSRAEAECDKMNDNARFFKWKQTYYLQKAELKDWEDA